MIKRNASRHALLGLILAGSLGAFVAQPVLADNAAVAEPAQATPTLGSNLQTLKELDGKAPARRALETSRPGTPPKAPKCCSSSPASCRCSTCA